MKTRPTKTSSGLKLTPCRCGRTPKLVHQERNIYAIECPCGVQFYPDPVKLSRQAVAEAWNKAGR